MHYQNEDKPTSYPILLEACISYLTSGLSTESQNTSIDVLFFGSSGQKDLTITTTTNQKLVSEEKISFQEEGSGGEKLKTIRLNQSQPPYDLFFFSKALALFGVSSYLALFVVVFIFKVIEEFPNE